MEINYEEIGKRIARRRKELGLKQSEAGCLSETGCH